MRYELHEDGDFRVLPENLGILKPGFRLLVVFPSFSRAHRHMDKRRGGPRSFSPSTDGQRMCFRIPLGILCLPRHMTTWPER